MNAHKYTEYGKNVSFKYEELYCKLNEYIHAAKKDRNIGECLIFIHFQKLFMQLFYKSILKSENDEIAKLIKTIYEYVVDGTKITEDKISLQIKIVFDNIKRLPQHILKRLESYINMCNNVCDYSYNNFITETDIYIKYLYLYLRFYDQLVYWKQEHELYINEIDCYNNIVDNDKLMFEKMKNINEYDFELLDNDALNMLYKLFTIGVSAVDKGEVIIIKPKKKKQTIRYDKLSELSI